MLNDKEWIILARFPDKRNGWQYGFGCFRLSIHRFSLAELVNALFDDPDGEAVWGNAQPRGAAFESNQVIDIHITQYPDRVYARCQSESAGTT